MDVQKRMDDYAQAVNAALEQYLPKPQGLQKHVIEAMRYSALAGGKRCWFLNSTGSAAEIRRRRCPLRAPLK